MSRFILSSLFLLTLSCAASPAQRVYWEPNAGSLAFEQASPLQLVFENCAPDGDPKLPPLDGLELVSTGSESSYAMVNMSVTRKRIFNFDARPTRRPEVRIPAFDVPTDKGVQHVAAATFAIGNATVGHTAIPLETAAKCSLEPAAGEFWAGEVFPVTYTLDVAERFNPRAQGSVVWTPAPLTVEEWRQPERFSKTTDGEARVGLIYKSRGLIATPGSYRIPAATQEIVLEVGTTGNLLNPFSSPEVLKHRVTSNEPSLSIKPLPDGAPADFGGAVGQFALTSNVVPTTVAVGEPVTWTLQLTGTGNWPDVHGLQAREVSKDFRVLQPQAKRTPAEGRLFDATLTEDVVLIPAKPGSYTLGPVTYSYFDPRTGAYRTLQTEPTTITITPPGTTEVNNRQLFTPPPSIASTSPAQATGALAPHLAAPPSAPAAIPRDPLPGADSGPVPFEEPWWSLWVLGSLLWLVPAWLIMAALRSRRTDPLRARREARRHLGQILAGLPHATTPRARIQALHDWQRQTAVLLDIAHAAPHAATILAHQSGDPEDKARRGADGAPWARLWAESDRVVYGKENPLPADWIIRAEAALEATRVPDWQSSSLFHRRNLLPWLAGNDVLTRPGSGVVSAIIVLFCLSFIAPAAFGANAVDPAGAGTAEKAPGYFASPREAYDAGDFPAAEQGWRAAVVRDPTDWIARHNLGLALAQQGHWPEAAAQWTSAFLLNPRNESVRWHLALGYERAEYTPPGLGEFAAASGPHLLARLASPAEWQWLLVGGGLLLAAGLLILLLRAYRIVSDRWILPAAFTAVAAALLLALATLTALHFYGEAADPRAAIAWHQVLLRSIPTEVDTRQKTSSLPAGSLGVVNKEFLGWVRLAFENGQTGWVRRQDIVWLYR